MTTNVVRKVMGRRKRSVRWTACDSHEAVYIKGVSGPQNLPRVRTILVFGTGQYSQKYYYWGIFLVVLKVKVKSKFIKRQKKLYNKYRNRGAGYATASHLAISVAIIKQMCLELAAESWQTVRF